MKQSLFFILISLIAIVGCTAYQNASRQNGAPLTVETKSETPKLDASMTDAEILAYFELDINTAEAEQVQGKDGIQMTYVSNERRVSIVRSQVSGLSIVADGTNPTGAWSPGKNE
jgi:hypothetical protein